jgi:histidine triad (HIT) family protein
MNTDCLFCKIITGEIPSQKIFEDGKTFAFLDIHPINRGHALVVPKSHHDNMLETPEDTFTQVMRTAQFLAPKIKKALNADGINIGINNGRAAGQLIFHLHVHIIPRFTNDGHVSWQSIPYKEGEIDEVQKLIEKELQ